MLGRFQPSPAPASWAKLVSLPGQWSRTLRIPASLEEGPLAIALRVFARVGHHNSSVFDDLNFLAAWEKGLVPWLSGILRMRQIRRANPIVALQSPPDRPMIPSWFP